MAWAGKNDGTPGALRDRKGKRTYFIGSYDPFRCGMCNGTTYVPWRKRGSFDNPRDTRLQKMCATCHPPKPGVEVIEDQVAGGVDG